MQLCINKAIEITVKCKTTIEDGKVKFYAMVGGSNIAYELNEAQFYQVFLGDDKVIYLNEEYTTEIEVLVELDGQFIRGFGDYFSSSFGNWLPGEPDDAEFCIKFMGHDLTNEIDSRLYDELTEFFIDEAKSSY